MRTASWNNIRLTVLHVFVLMLENRSFDHMLGFSGITGTDAVSGQTMKIAGLTGTSRIPITANRKMSSIRPIGPCQPTATCSCPGSTMDVPAHFSICLTASNEMVERSLPVFAEVAELMRKERRPAP
jgi:hypothetical protein